MAPASTFWSLKGLIPEFVKWPLLKGKTTYEELYFNVLDTNTPHVFLSLDIHCIYIQPCIYTGCIYICEAGRPNQCQVGHFRHAFFLHIWKG